MNNPDPVSEALDRVLEELGTLRERTEVIEKRMAGRKAIGEHPDAGAFDCPGCGQYLGVMLTVSTGEIHAHYGGQKVRFVPHPGQVFAIDCKRCGATYDGWAILEELLEVKDARAD